MEIGDKTEWLDMIECNNKDHANWSMVIPKDFVRCTIKRDLTNIKLNIYQPYLITKTTQVFNNHINSIDNFDTPDTPHKGIVRNK